MVQRKAEVVVVVVAVAVQQEDVVEVVRQEVEVVQQNVAVDQVKNIILFYYNCELAVR